MCPRRLTPEQKFLNAALRFCRADHEVRCCEGQLYELRQRGMQLAEKKEMEPDADVSEKADEIAEDYKLAMWDRAVAKKDKYQAMYLLRKAWDALKRGE